MSQTHGLIRLNCLTKTSYTRSDVLWCIEMFVTQFLSSGRMGDRRAPSPVSVVSACMRLGTTATSEATDCPGSCSTPISSQPCQLWCGQTVVTNKPHTLNFGSLTSTFSKITSPACARLECHVPAIPYHDGHAVSSLRVSTAELWSLGCPSAQRPPRGIQRNHVVLLCWPRVLQ